MRLAVCCEHPADLPSMLGACAEAGVDAIQVPLLSAGWLQALHDARVDGALMRPPRLFSEHKAVFDERALVMATALGIPTYPSYRELLTYENKRLMAGWLQALGIDHPETHVFTDAAEARAFLATADYPIVSKASIGSAGSTVRVLRTRRRAEAHVARVFGFGRPDFAWGDVPWIRTKRPPFLPLPRPGQSQRHYALFQRFEPHEFEWRLIRIGDTLVGHRKLLDDRGYASGSGRVGWVAPGPRELDLLWRVSEGLGFRTVALDVLATPDGRLLVNEIQPIYGSYDPAQMYVDGEPGRFVREPDGTYRLEPGAFCGHGSWGPRVLDFLARLRSGAAMAPA